MKNWLSFSISLFLITNHSLVLCPPIIQNVTNNTNFAFAVVWHSDESSCSLQGKSVIILPGKTVQVSALLTPGAAGFILRPIWFLKQDTNEQIWLTDQAYNYDRQKIKEAYSKIQNNFKFKYNNNTDVAWFDKWVGGDISVQPHQVEILGYLLNLSRVEIANKRYRHNAWLSFAKGIFSKLIIDINITQHARKGVRAAVDVHHGEGGICVEGKVQLLT